MGLSDPHVQHCGLWDVLLAAPTNIRNTWAAESSYPTPSLLLGTTLCADLICPYLWLFAPGLLHFLVILQTLLITALCYYLLGFSAVKYKYKFFVFGKKL